MKFFTYGIFLDWRTRRRHGLNGLTHYATIQGYSTVGNHIVYAVPTKGHTLTGLVLDITPENLQTLDGIELGAGYKRVTVKTEGGEDVELYVMDEEAMYARPY